MEAIGVVSSVLIIVTLVDQGAKLMKNIAKVSGDTRFEIAKWELWAEKKAIDAWASNMRRNQGSIPEAEKENVDKLIYAMRITLDKLDARMKKYEPFAKSRDNSKPIIQLAKLRIAWLNSGKEEVQDLLKLVKTLNKALNIAAPPLPEYPGVPGAFGQAGQSGTFQTPGTTTYPTPSAHLHEDPSVVADITNSVEHQTAIAIQQLFNVCAGSTSDMMRYGTQSRELLARTKDRLSLWHQGLFNSALGLEVILAERNAEARIIREFLVSCLVDIAYTEEQVLARWLEDQQTPNRNKLEEVRGKLTVALARDETSLLTLERWKLSLTEDEAFGPKTDKEDFEFIASIVDVLFDVLPAIRALRRRVVLSAESKAKRRITSIDEVQADTAQAEVSDNATVKLVEANLQQARDLEREAQAMGQPKVTIMSRRLAKTIQRLEEWRLDALEDPQVAAGAHSNSEVLKKQEELARVLSKFFHPASKEKDPATTSEKDPATTSEKDPATISEKGHAVPNRSELTPENIGLLVEAADFAARHLFVATQVS